MTRCAKSRGTPYLRIELRMVRFAELGDSIDVRVFLQTQPIPYFVCQISVVRRAWSAFAGSASRPPRTSRSITANVMPMLSL